MAQPSPAVAPGSSSQRPAAAKEALLKGYNKRLKDNVKSMVENFTGKIGILVKIKRHLNALEFDKNF